MILIPLERRGLKLTCLALLLLPAIGFNASLYQNVRIHTPMLDRDLEVYYAHRNRTITGDHEGRL